MPQTEPRKHRSGWRRCKCKRPSEILEATFAVIREQGFDNIRIADIAARAGITKGTIYLYFESKDALLNIAKNEMALHQQERKHANTSEAPKRADTLQPHAQSCAPSFLNV